MSRLGAPGPLGSHSSTRLQNTTPMSGTQPVCISSSFLTAFCQRHIDFNLGKLQLSFSADIISTVDISDAIHRRTTCDPGAVLCLFSVFLIFFSFYTSYPCSCSAQKGQVKSLVCATTIGETLIQCLSTDQLSKLVADE